MIIITHSINMGNSCIPLFFFLHYTKSDNKVAKDYTVLHGYILYNFIQQNKKILKQEMMNQTIIVLLILLHKSFTDLNALFLSSFICMKIIIPIRQKKNEGNLLQEQRPQHLLHVCFGQHHICAAEE